jgi:hypothetical protein
MSEKSQALQRRGASLQPSRLNFGEGVGLLEKEVGMHPARVEAGRLFGWRRWPQGHPDEENIRTRADMRAASRVDRTGLPEPGYRWPG